MPRNGRRPRSSQLRFRRRRPGKIVQKRACGCDEIEFSRHALDRMRQRGVSENEVINAIRRPTRTGLPTPPGRERVRKNRRSSGAVDIVYVKKGKRLVIVTVIHIRSRRTRK